MKKSKKYIAMLSVASILAGSIAGNGMLSVQAEENEKAPVLEYNFDEEYAPGVVKDSAGNHDARITNGASYVQDKEYGQVLYLDGGTEVGGHNSYLEFPEGYFDGMDTMTISMDVNEVTRKGFYFTFGIGVNDTKYMFLRTDPTAMKLAITSQGAFQENVAETSFVYPNNVREWINVKMVITPSSLQLYQDGKLIAEKADVNCSISDFGSNLKAYVGKSFFEADKYFRGYFDNIKVYDYAMTASEVKETTEAEAAARETAMTDIHYVADHFEIPNANDIRGNITLPKEEKGVSITWTSSDENVISTKAVENKDYDETPAGVVTRQEKDRIVKLTATFSKGKESVVKHYNVTVKAKQDAKDEEYKGYLFVHFTGTEATAMQEQTYFSISKDGLNWENLNGGNPVLVSTIGESGLRDHYIGRSAEGDKFYMIATDLSIFHGDPDWGQNWEDARRNGGNGVVVWESEDLVNWSEPWITDFAPENAGCTWAPEFVYDHKTGEYVVFWSATTLELDENENITKEYGNYAIYYAKTRDFRNFTETKLYNPTEEEAAIPNRNVVIDSTVIEDDGIYYRYTKNEGNGQIQIDYSDSMLGEFTDIPSETMSTTVPEKFIGVEGPIIFKMNEKTADGKDQWCLMVDRFILAQGYYPLITTDLSSGEFELLDSSEFSFPEKFRHGYVLPITAAEYDTLQAKWGSENYFSTATAEQLIDKAYQLNADDYTEKSYDNLVNVLTDAEDSLKACKTMKEVNAISEKVQKAVDELVPIMESLEVIAPDETTYYIGETLDTTGMVVVASYADGTAAEIKEGYSLSGYQPYAAGKQRVTVTYNDMKASFEVNVEGKGLPYADVAAGDWFYDAAAYTYYKGLMTGTDATHFAPYNQLARAQFALILYRMEGEPAVNTDKSFGDIRGDEWYGPAVLWAAEQGIVTGYTDTKLFGPADNITREQMVVMMHRYAKYLNKDTSTSAGLDTFTDASSVSEFAAKAMGWAVGKGIITGKDNGTRIEPWGNTSRAEAAIIIQRFMEK